MNWILSLLILTSNLSLARESVAVCETKRNATVSAEFAIDLAQMEVSVRVFTQYANGEISYSKVMVDGLTIDSDLVVRYKDTICGTAKINRMDDEDYDLVLTNRCQFEVKKVTYFENRGTDYLFEGKMSILYMSVQ